MNKNEIAIDLGYSSAKIKYQDRLAKFPTAISFASDIGTAYGNENIYEFEGDRYYVGKEAVGSESFTTSEFKFLLKFAPLIIFHVLNKFNEADLTEPVVIKTGLAIVDWDKKDEFIERISNIEVNDIKIKVEPYLMPQGAGCAIDYIETEGIDYPDSLTVLDLGFNTINLLNFEDGKPIRKNIKAYPGHGVSSILKPFTSYMENKFAVTFSDQESIKVFLKGTFKYNGIEQEDVQEKIQELKSQFVKKLFNSVLVNEKKLLAMSDIVLIAGGGAYMLEDIDFPPNVKFVPKFYEFSNVRGYASEM